MSNYTTELRFICESYAGKNASVGYGEIENVINTARNKVFDFSYPIFDESYRPVLESKILYHYYLREICEETVGIWKLRLRTKMNEIMPYYNKLYQSELIQFDPMKDIDLTTDHTKEGSGENEKTSQNERVEDRDTSGNELTTNNLHDVGTESKDTVTTNDLTDVMTNNLTDTITNDLTDTQTNALADIRNINASDNSSTNATAEEVTEFGKTVDTTGEGTDTKWDFYSDTPQGNIYNFPGETQGVSNQMEYLTNARKNTDEYENEKHTTDGGDETKTGEGQSSTTTQHAETDRLDKTGTVTTDKDGTVVTDKEGTVTTDKTGTVTVEVDGRTTLDKTGTVNTAKTGTEDATTTDDYSENGTFSNTEEYLEHIVGKRSYSTYSKMLMEFRETFLNIDMMVIKDLAPLFFNLW